MPREWSERHIRDLVKSEYARLSADGSFDMDLKPGIKDFINKECFGLEKIGPLDFYGLPHLRSPHVSEEGYDGKFFEGLIMDYIITKKEWIEEYTVKFEYVLKINNLAVPIYNQDPIISASTYSFGYVPKETVITKKTPSTIFAAKNDLEILDKQLNSYRSFFHFLLFDWNQLLTDIDNIKTDNPNITYFFKESEYDGFYEVGMRGAYDFDKESHKFVSEGVVTIKI